MRLPIVIALIVSLCAPIVVAAEVKTIFVDTIIKAPSAPEEVTIFSRIDRGEVVFSQGQAKPVTGREGTWVIGGAAQVPATAQVVSVSYLASAASDRAIYVPWQEIPYSASDKGSGSVNLLREEVLETKRSVESLQQRLQEVQLSAEAAKRRIEEVEGGQMLRASEFELAGLQETRRGMESDLASLEHAVARMKVMPPPKNAARREVELQQQVALFAGLAKSAEVGEVARQEQGVVDEEQARLLIETTQYENEEELVQKLDRLREHRALLEDR